MTMSNLLSLLSQPALVIWLVKATALLLAALAATAVLRRASAGTRHLVWVGTLGGILLLPALSLWPPLRLAVLPASLTRLTFSAPLPIIDAATTTSPVHPQTSMSPAVGIDRLPATSVTNQRAAASVVVPPLEGKHIS